MTTKQKKVYDLLLQKKNMMEIARELGRVPSTVHEMLTVMEKKGWVKRYKYRRPTWGPVEEFDRDYAKAMLKKIRNKYPSLLTK